MTENPDLINELFERDPDKLTRDDISQLITALQRGRAQFNLSAKDPVSKAARKGSANPKPTLDLSALGLKPKPVFDLSALNLKKKD